MAKKAEHYLFVFFGTPKAQQRPRFATRKNGRPVCYDAMSDKKALDRTMVMSQMRDAGLMHLLEEPIAVEMKFHLGGATTRSTARLNGKPKPNKPDIDNMAKYYLDIMTDLVFKDDRFVTTLHCEKVYSDKKKVEVIVTPLGHVLKKKEKEDV